MSPLLFIHQRVCLHDSLYLYMVFASSCVISAQCSERQSDGISKKRGQAAGATGNPGGTHMLRHLLLVMCMNGIKRCSVSPLTLKRNPSHRNGFETSGKQTLFGSTQVLFCGVLVPLKPTAQLVLCLTVVHVYAQFVPRNFDDINVMIFQYVGIGSHSTGIRWCPMSWSRVWDVGFPRCCVVSLLFVPYTTTRPPCGSHCSAGEECQTDCDH